ncbi:hypothetical protein [Comamonas sp.]|uniref:hypothetical protein n=1 Tax=Comamonas sp. TaxID=34028 RepID=UPI00289D3C75|nr:hypothetical protein [Comamonas sp.]
MLRRPVLAVWGRWAAMAAAGMVLTACMVPQWQKPGTPASAIHAGMGEPHVKVPLQGGGERWVYSRQPAGQQVYHMEFDAQQRLQKVEQVLDEAHFQRLQPGQDNRGSVFRYFGKPALVEGVGNFKGDIWTYRIQQNGIDRQAHVFIDPQGVVQRIMFTDEARNDDEQRH